MSSNPSTRFRDNPAACRRVFICAGLVLLGTAVMGWWATTNPKVPLLMPQGPAEWIVFPLSPVTRPRAYVDLPAIYHQQFEIETLPTKAKVRVRALRLFRLVINGTRVGDSPAGANWKKTSAFDVTSYLKPGVNHVQVRVVNDLGPPALWMVMESGKGEVLLASDVKWDVSIADSHGFKARAATDFPHGAEIDPQRPPMRIGAIWPTPILVVLLLGVVAVWSMLYLRGLRGRVSPDRISIGLMIAVTAVIWSALFFNNAGILHPRIGYDSSQHLNYIQFLLDNHELPLINQGFEMNQPPLYYVLSAVLLEICGLEATDNGAAYVLRAFGLVAGAVHVAMIVLMLHLVFPDHRRRVLIGWLLAAALPVHLYLFQFVTNEWLFATLATVALYLGMRMVVHGSYGWPSAIALGVCFGAALLTKLTAIVPIAVITLMIICSLAQRRQRDVYTWLRAAAVPTGIAVAMGGWHYGRSWTQTGSLFVTSNDSSSGYIWWQDPGYSTPGFYLRFGQVISEPFYSGLSSFADGVYSTLFGDAMFAATKAGTVIGWNSELMMVCYVLSLLPALAVIVGGIACVKHMLIKPRIIDLALLLLPLLMLAAMVMFSLRVANYGCSKVFYGLCAVGPCCVLAAWGLDVMMSRGKVIRNILRVLLAAWILSAYGSFWIVRNTPITSINLAATSARLGRTDDAIKLLEKTLRIAPSNQDARLGLITLLGQRQRLDEALTQAKYMVDHMPTADAHWAAGWVLDRMGKREQATVHARQAVQLAPQHPKALLLLADLLDRTGHVQQAIEVYRQTLRRDPDDRYTHKALSRLYTHLGDIAAAQFHGDIARMMDERIGYSPWSH